MNLCVPLLLVVSGGGIQLVVFRFVFCCKSNPVGVSDQDIIAMFVLVSAMERSGTETYFTVAKS